MDRQPIDVDHRVDLRKQSSPVEYAGRSGELVTAAEPAVGKVRGAVTALPTQLRKLPAQVQKLPVQLQKTVADVVRLLADVIARLRLPLLILVLAPVAPALVLLVASVARGGSDVPLAFVLVAVGVIPSAWLAVRRHQLLNALQPPEQAAAQMWASVSAPDIWAQVRGNVVRLADRSEKLRLRSLSRRLWRGVRVSMDLKNSVTDSPRFAPFLPSRLRGLAYLAGWCLLSFVVLTVLAAAKLLASSLGVG